MKKDLLIEVDNGQVRLAVLEDGTLAEFYVERRGQEKLAGNIYKGRVANILPGMQAAFVDIGLEKNAFLHAGDIQIDRADFGGDEAAALERQLCDQPIQKLLRVGQEILVQVIKESGGTKGPRITSHMTLPGRLAVLLPTVSYVGISRRITDEAERARLRELAAQLQPTGMGLIVRTAALHAGEEEFQRDIAYLHKLWDSIQVRAAHCEAPLLLHRDESLTYRAVRDMLVDDVEALVIDDPVQYESALEVARMLSPELCARVRLHDAPTPLFDLHRVDTALEKAFARKVWLKSGGYLVIDHTEALTVIDVNTGKYVGSNSLAQTVYDLNCEAVYEIVRQLRLRDVGGIIVIDFIDMELAEHREQLLGLLRAQLRRDHTKTNLVGLTGLGLVEMTRKKVHQPLHKVLKRTCPLCQGSGMIPNEETIARAILHALRARIAAETPECWLAHASAAVAGQLMLLGAPPGLRAYVAVDAHRRDDSWNLDAACERELPPKARRIPRAI